MSTALATSIALALYALALIPLALVQLRPSSARFIGPLYGVAIVAVGAMNVGWIRTDGLTPVRDLQVPLQADRQRCDQILDILRRAGVVTGISPSGELQVRQDAWDQLPPSIRDVANACAEQSHTAASETAPTNGLVPPGT